MEWVQVSNGRVWARGRPGLRLIAALPPCRVVTLLSEREGAPQLGELVRAAGLSWTWLPLGNGRPPEGGTRKQAIATVPSQAAYLRQGESLLIHCAAGLHRTGMITWALLRCPGHSTDEARALLERIRAETLRPK
jgi:hypothetical protein